jgi:hypothetical protein
MGGFSAQVQQPTNRPSGGKGIAGMADQVSAPEQQYQAPQPMAKGGNYQSNATSGQPRMGQQNPYPNTVGQWDNARIQPIGQQGKGKGA